MGAAGAELLEEEEEEEERRHAVGRVHLAAAVECPGEAVAVCLEEWLAEAPAVERLEERGFLVAEACRAAGRASPAEAGHLAEEEEEDPLAEASPWAEELPWAAKRCVRRFAGRVSWM